MNPNVEKLKLWSSWSDPLGWTLLDLWRSFEKMNEIRKMSATVSIGDDSDTPLYCDWFLSHMTVGIRRMIDLSNLRQNPSIALMLRDMRKLNPPIGFQDYIEFLNCLRVEENDPRGVIETGSDDELHFKAQWLQISDANGDLSRAVIQGLESRLEQLTRRVKEFTNGEIAHHGGAKQPPTAVHLFEALSELDAIYCDFCLFLNPSLQPTHMRILSQFGDGAIRPSTKILAIEARATERRNAFWQSLTVVQNELNRKVDWKVFMDSLE